MSLEQLKTELIERDDIEYLADILHLTVEELLEMQEIHEKVVQYYLEEYSTLDMEGDDEQYSES